MIGHGFRGMLSGFGSIVAPTVTTTGDVTIGGRTTSAGFTSSIAGTGATPAYNWSTDTDNGLYYSGAANRWELAAGGADVWSVRTALAVAYVPFSASSTSNLGNTVTLGAGVNLVLTSGYIQLSEIAAPGAGAADTVRIYAVVDGGSKTDLVAIFQSGAAQIAAQEP